MKFLSCRCFLSTQLKKICASILVLIILIIPGNQSLDAGDSITVFLFNPDGKPALASKVKSSLESHLKDKGIDARVMIFRKSVDFENSLQHYKPHYAIASFYYYKAKYGEYRWNILLSGYNNNSGGYNKILLTLNSIKSPIDLVNKGISTISLGSATSNFVSDQLQNLGLTAGNVRIIPVTQNMDAIMALALNQVAGAIVSQDSYGLLKNINPELINQIKIFSQLPTIPHPLVVSFGNAKNNDSFIAAMKNLDENVRGKVVFEYFGLTKFR